MRKIFVFWLFVLALNTYAQQSRSDSLSMFFDIGLGGSFARTGYLLYTDITGVPCTNDDDNLNYAPALVFRAKIRDVNFKYRLIVPFAYRNVEDIPQESNYEHSTSYLYRGIYPRFGIERIIWSRWFELAIGLDALYFYEKHDMETFAKGELIPNLSLEMNGLSKHTTKALGFSPVVSLGVPIKNRIFVSVEVGKYYAYGKTWSSYSWTSKNLNTGRVNNSQEDAVRPSDFYRLSEDNLYIQFSIDYRFEKPRSKYFNSVSSFTRSGN